MECFRWKERHGSQAGGAGGQTDCLAELNYREKSYARKMWGQVTREKYVEASCGHARM